MESREIAPALTRRWIIGEHPEYDRETMAALAEIEDAVRHGDDEYWTETLAAVAGESAGS